VTHDVLGGAPEQEPLDRRQASAADDDRVDPQLLGERDGIAAPSALDPASVLGGDESGQSLAVVVRGDRREPAAAVTGPPDQDSLGWRNGGVLVGAGVQRGSGPSAVTPYRAATAGSSADSARPSGG